MNDKDIQQILELLGQTLTDTVSWRLDGSANLRVQGVNVKVKDIDICVNMEGINQCRILLKKYIARDFENKRTNGHTLVLSILGAEVEINHYNDNRLSMLDNRIVTTWKSLKIPTLPLDQAKVFYEIIGRKEKVSLIHKHTQS